MIVTPSSSVWDTLRQSHPVATAWAEQGDLTAAVRSYASSGCYVWTPSWRRRAEKAELAAGLRRGGNRNLAHKAVRAHFFLRAFRAHQAISARAA